MSNDFVDSISNEVLSKELFKQKTELYKIKKDIQPFLNLAIDYNLTLDQLYEICVKAIENGEI